jgi:hypothetical protein
VSALGSLAAHHDRHAIFTPVGKVNPSHGSTRMDETTSQAFSNQTFRVWKRQQSILLNYSPEQAKAMLSTWSVK